jgi:hypothetical protein
VIGEELGFVGVLCVIGLFFWLTRRIMHIGRQAIALDRVFAGLVAQGVGIWMGGQAFINMGVNLGALPTKGLTLPLMSYGGSAILMNLVALASCCASMSRTGNSCGEGAYEREVRPDHGRRHRGPHLPRPGRGAGPASGAGACIGWERPAGMESQIVPPRGFAFEGIDFAGCAARAWSRWRCCRCACSRRSGRACRWCAGCGPTCWSGWVATSLSQGGMMGVLLGKPLVLHEQNSVAGMANKVLAGHRRPHLHGVSRRAEEGAMGRQSAAHGVHAAAGASATLCRTQRTAAAAGRRWQPGRQGAQRGGAEGAWPCCRSHSGRGSCIRAAPGRSMHCGPDTLRPVSMPN